MAEVRETEPRLDLTCPLHVLCDSFSFFHFLLYLFSLPSPRSSLVSLLSLASSSPLPEVLSSIISAFLVRFARSYDHFSLLVEVNVYLMPVLVAFSGVPVNFAHSNR